jgi:hypothetical protein
MFGAPNTRSSNGFGAPSLAGNRGRSVRLSMFNTPIAALAAATTMVAALACGTGSVWADHRCDPLDPVADVGWNVVPSHETVGAVDSAPFQAGAGGIWFVNRTTTVVPFCNYYNELGIYSMRSYTLAPQVKEERIGICQATAQGASVPVPPYAGRCPPR